MAVPLVGVAGYFAYRAERSGQRLAEQRLVDLGQAAAAGIGQFLTYSEHVLAGLAADPRVQALDADACAGGFPTLQLPLGPVFLSLDLWAGDGTLLCSTLPPTETPVNLRGTGSFDEALASPGFRISPIFRERRTGAWSTALTHPVSSGAGEPGILSATVDLVRFQEILRRLALPEEAVVTVTQQDGIVVARSRDPGAWVGLATPPPQDADDGGSRTLGSTQAAALEGTAHTWGFLRIPDSPWTIYVGLPTRSVYGDVVRQRSRLLLGGLMMLLSAAVAGLVVHRRITRPLEGLVEGIAASDAASDAPLPVGGPREVAWVAERFNQAWAELRREREERLRSDARIRSVVENAVTGIYVSTERGRFLEVNRALVELLGFASREELLATPVQEVYARREDREQLILAEGAAPSFRGIPATWRRKDGRPLDVRLFGRRFHLEDGETAWEVIVEDVTELTRLQEQAAYSQKMEALGRMAGGIAHDFNNLLTVVQGQADMLREDPALAEDHRAQATEILEAAVRGADLNRQLLAFSRGTPGAPEPLDLTAVVARMAVILHRTVGEDVRIDIEPGEEAPVLADRSQLEQVLMNLVVNARDAMPDGGRLTVRTFRGEVAAADAARYPGARRGPHAVLEVRDTGPGIPDDVLPHIFEPFFTTKGASSGTGLGLATVYGIASSARGHVRVETARGAGTSFQVWIPRHHELPDSPAEGAQGQPPPAACGSILLVEDEPSVRRFTERVLTKAGYRVTAVSDGLEALQLGERPGLRFDLLVSDVVMPGLRGPEVAERLCAAGTVRKVVLVSGYAEGLPADGLSGVDDWTFLAKPFSTRELVDTVERMLARP